MEDIKKLLIRMADTANAAQAHYQIWFTLRGEDKALLEFYDEMNDYRYVDFFRANNSGNYKLMFIELCCLFDNDSRAASFKNLTSLLKKNDHTTIVEKIESTLDPYKQLVNNSHKIRSKLIAHKETSASPEDLYQKYPIIPNQIGELLEICCNIINDINDLLFGKTNILIAPTESRFEKATFALLEVLKDGRS